VPNQRTNGQAVRSNMQAIQRIDAIDVDEYSGAEDATIEHGHQALAARQYSAIRPAITQNTQGVFQAARRVVVEPCRLHELFNLFSMGPSIRAPSPPSPLTERAASIPIPGRGRQLTPMGAVRRARPIC
jgi:hypothetical protein